MSNQQTKTTQQKIYRTLSDQVIDKNKTDLLLAPIMIVGCPRSGTTWLQKLLLENQNIFGGQESYIYSLFYPAFSSVKDSSNARRVGLSSYWKVEEFNTQMQEVWIRTFLPMLNNKPQATVLLEKTPFHALFIDDILDFLPNTKFIHLIRDSRAVTASFNAASKGWGNYWAPTSTKKSALEWYRLVNKARSSVAAKDSSRYLEVHYEDLLEYPVSELTRILKFMGLSENEEAIRKTIENQSFSKQQKEKGSGLIDSEGMEIKEPSGFFRKGTSDSWKNDLNIVQKLIVWRFTRKLMKECGYNWNGRNRKL
jgi:sulfotransferase family protein